MPPLAYFVRHGQTDWNAEGRLQGQAETDLNEVGRRQADRNGAHLAKLIAAPETFDFVASPMRRTRRTMERLRAAMGLDPQAYRTDRSLIEMSFGDWQGSTLAELEQRKPGCTAGRDADKWNFLPPGAGAESYRMLADRVRPWFEALARPTVCVTHGGILRALFFLTGSMTEEEAGVTSVPQDRILELRDGRLAWL
jgi:probable phosphoglycerate mutase